jgi:hypothetical protein
MLAAFLPLRPAHPEARMPRAAPGIDVATLAAAGTRMAREPMRLRWR